MKYSIIIPIHNVEPYIEECLCSIISQSYYDYEVICVVNGSTDGSESICKKYEEQFKQVKCIVIDETGVSNARNKGLFESKGEIIWFVDGDDLLAPDALEKVDKVFSMHNIDVGVFAYKTLGKDGFVREQKYIETGVVKSQIALNGLYDSKKWSGFVWNKLFKRDVLLEIIFDSDIGMIEDLLFTTKVFLNSKSIYISSEIIYIYRQRADSVSHGFSNIKITSFIAYERILGLLQENEEDYQFAINVIGNAKCDFSRMLLCYYFINDKYAYRKYRKELSNIIVQNYHCITSIRAKLGTLMTLVSPRISVMLRRRIK